jgi:hypothetical protein
MHLLLCGLLLQPSPVSAQDVFVGDADAGSVRCSPDFVATPSPYAQGGAYLSAPSQGPGATPGSVRVAAPAGDFYVYLTWVRHPQGAGDVRVRVGGLELTVDQSRLANGRSPDEFERDDMAAFAGLCSSGLFRLTERPLRLQPGDAVEILRSDTEAGRVTTFDGVLFSRHLYLDDLGNDATVTGLPLINLKDYGQAMSGEAGLGIAFLRPQGTASAVEFIVPADGPFLLSADPNRGPSRAGSMSLTVTLPDGGSATLAVAGRAAACGRSQWEDLGVLAHARGATIRLTPAADGFSCMDLLRLTPLRESDLAATATPPYHEFTLQWHSASAERPWLRDVRAVSPGGDAVQMRPIRPAAHPQGQVPAGFPDEWWVADCAAYEPWGLTLAQTYVYLDPYVDGPIPAEKLAWLQASFDELRRNGLKAVLRFAYERDMGGPVGPTLDWVLEHIDQLAPVIRANCDVIFVIQAGFVGAWGE